MIKKAMTVRETDKDHMGRFEGTRRIREIM